MQVRVGLRPETDIALDKPEEIYQPPSARGTATRGESLSLTEAIDRYRRLVVLADPGTGKTWTVHTNAVRIASNSREQLTERGHVPDELVIPVRLRCDTLAKLFPAALTHATCELLTQRHNLAPGLRIWLEQHLNAGSALYLLDALDEVPRDQRGALTEMIRCWEQTTAARQGRMVLTSRIAEYQTMFDPTERTEVELLPFNVHSVSAFIRSWGLQPAAAAAVYERLRSPALVGLARIPLLLAMFVRINRNHDLIPAELDTHRHQPLLTRSSMKRGGTPTFGNAGLFSHSPRDGGDRAGKPVRTQPERRQISSEPHPITASKSMAADHALLADIQ